MSKSSGLKASEMVQVFDYLEHFKFLCAGLGRREDEVGKEENYSPTCCRVSISDAAK